MRKGDEFVSVRGLVDGIVDRKSEVSSTISQGKWGLPCRMHYRHRLAESMDPTPPDTLAVRVSCSKAPAFPNALLILLKAPLKGLSLEHSSLHTPPPVLKGNTSRMKCVPPSQFSLSDSL